MRKARTKTTRKEGIFYKAVYAEFERDPFPSKSHSGRFHLNGVNITYVTPKQETAWKEISFRWKADPTSFRMVTAAVRLNIVVDLTDEQVQKESSITREDLVGSDYRPTQGLAKVLRSQEVEGIWTYSRADEPDGRTLVIFLDKLAPGSYVRVRATEKMKLS